jgi:hypothetical protein
MKGHFMRKLLLGISLFIALPALANDVTQPVYITNQSVAGTTVGSPLFVAPVTSNVPLTDMAEMANAIIVTTNTPTVQSYNWNAGNSYPLGAIWVKITGTNESGTADVTIQGSYSPSASAADWVALTNSTGGVVTWSMLASGLTSDLKIIPVPMFANYVRLNIVNGKAHSVTVYAYGMGKIN